MKCIFLFCAMALPENERYINCCGDVMELLRIACQYDTQYLFAKKINEHESHYGAYERGVNAKVLTIRPMLKAMGVEVGEYYTLVDDKMEGRPVLLPDTLIQKERPRADDSYAKNKKPDNLLTNHQKPSKP